MSMSAPVLHGRRQGQMYSTKGTELPELAHTSNKKPVDLHQVAVLSKTDWEGIQYRLHKRQIEAEKIRKLQEEKKALHEQSLERVKNWSNTVLGQRQKKLEERQKRLEREEEERKKIDVEEALIQAQQRKAIIEKAKTQQYYQTDRVKNFHSALLLTEVLKEREAQVELQRLRNEALISQDKGWLEKLQDDAEQAKRSEEEKALKRREETMKTVSFQKAQMNEQRKQLDKRREEEALEAEELRRLAAAHAEEERRKQELREQRAAEQAADNRRQIEDIEYMKNINKMQEEEEDEECRLFAAAKRKMMRMRAEKEKQLRNEKQAQLDIIQQKLMSQMQEKVSDEDQRIRAAVAEREARLAAEEAEKAEKRRQMLESIKEHRYEQARLEEARLAREKQEESELLKARLESDVVYHRNEAEKLNRKKTDAKILSDIHLEQLGKRQIKEKIFKEQDLEQERRNQEMNDIEEAQFQAYAREVIDHCETRGRNTYPLRKVANQVIPGRAVQATNYVVTDDTGALLPNFQTAGTNSSKQTINGNTHTSKHLGFVW